jgi:hypothetical protein
MKTEHEVEVLPPLTEGEQEFPLLRVQYPMEQLKDLFDGIAKVQDSAVLWAEKTVIDSPTTRDEARRLRQMIKGTVATIDEKRLMVTQPVRAYLDDLKALCDQVSGPLLLAVNTLDAKGIAYAEECRRAEQQKKDEALARQRAEEDRIKAERQGRGGPCRGGPHRV